MPSRTRMNGWKLPIGRCRRTYRQLQLQHSLLPVELPKIRGMNFAFRFRPCSDVGGDSINVFSLDDQHVALYILDVSGHGVAAALLSVTLTHMLSALPDRSFLYHAATDNPDAYSITSPAEVVSRLNRWDEKTGLRTGCCRLPSYRRARSANR